MEDYQECPSHAGQECCPWAGGEGGCGECTCCLEGTVIHGGEAMPLEDAVWEWLGTQPEARARIGAIANEFVTVSRIAIHDAVVKLAARGGCITYGGAPFIGTVVQRVE